jgi:hypothetical protein
MAELRHSRGVRMFVFHDDDFFTQNPDRDLARVTALRDALWARDVRDIAVVVEARPDDLSAPVFAVLQQIGLLRVYLGIEAGCSQDLRTLGRGVSLSANWRGLEFLRGLNVFACYNMLIFDPETTLGSLRESLDFIRQNADIPMNFCRTEVYVGTPLMQRLARQGRLRGDVFGWDYSISDPPADRAFRLFARAFVDRNFRCDGLMNSNLGLGYHLHLLKQFYPHALSPELWQRCVAVIRRVNLDSVGWMERIADFAESPAASENAASEGFAARITESAEQASRSLENLVGETTAQLAAAARGQRSSATPLWCSVAAATLALSPLACDPVPPQHPPDPLPPPTQTVSPEDEPPDDSRFAEPPPGDDDAVIADPTAPEPPPPPPPPHDPVPPPHPRPDPRPPPPPPDPLPPPHDLER